MEEEDQADNVESQAPETEATAEDGKPSRGKKDGSDTHRTDKSEFLDPPEGALEQKQSAGERVVKIDLPEGEASTFGKKKVVKKKANGKANATKKTNGKESPPKNATEQAVGIYSVKKAGSKDDSQQKSSGKEKTKGIDSNKNKVITKGNGSTKPPNDKHSESQNEQIPNGNDNHVEDGNKIDSAKDFETGEEIIENTKDTKNSTAGDTEKNVDGAKSEDNNDSSQEKSEGADKKAQQSPKSKKPQVLKAPPGFYEKSHEEEVAYRAKLRTSYVPPKPKVKSQPALTEEEELLAKQAVLERRKSQRFIGLDPEKVAQAKINPPKPIKEENPPPPKPKTERFVGLKIKPGGKSPRKEDKADNNQNVIISADNDQSDLVEANIIISEDIDGEQDMSEDRRQENLMVPSVELLTPLPRRNESRTDVGDVGYDANMPSTPMMIMNGNC
ncbi:hypothetical protein EGW08_017830 [Elysia chlorotica]|uniref:Uncharacterized protein n=1 Tax=Elysia chlorotica TaxID=188477 RepID=A0A3S1B2D9_ELYCH|nr:hypothetical protein EGW08_017830 [Elysia chlorotica]